MVTTATKPPKITADLLQSYIDARDKRIALDVAAKPFVDKEKQLGKEIKAALEAAEVTTKKAGKYRASLVEKPGLVNWKDACVERLKSGELEKLQEAVPSRYVLDVQPA